MDSENSLIRHIASGCINNEFGHTFTKAMIDERISLNIKCCIGGLWKSSNKYREGVLENPVERGSLEELRKMQRVSKSPFIASGSN